jgi:MFS family permease
VVPSRWQATQLQPKFGSHTAAQLALGLYIAYNVAATVISLPAGRATDKLGAKGAIPVLAIGVSLFALSYASLGLDTTSVLGLAPGFVFAGLAIGIVETAENAAVAAFAPADLRGSAFGLLATVQSLGNLAASAVAGVIWSAFGAPAAFRYLVIWMVAATAALVVVLMRQPRTPATRM